MKIHQSSVMGAKACFLKELAGIFKSHEEARRL
jgi:hypothetical protein